VTRERDIESALVRSVRARGGKAYKFTSPAQRGVPDRIVCLPEWERPVFVELKAPGRKPTKLQLHEHRVLRRLNQHVVVVDSHQAIDELLESDR